MFRRIDRPASVNSPVRSRVGLLFSLLVIVVAVASILLLTTVRPSEPAVSAESAWRAQTSMVLQDDLEALEARGAKRSPLSGGDTVFIRHAGLLPSADPAIGYRLAAIGLMADPENRLQRLSALHETAANAPMRYRVRLEMLRVLIASGRREEAAALARELTAQEALPPLVTVDAHYLWAMSQRGGGTPVPVLDAFRRAVAIDPDYWNARQAMILHLARHAALFVGDTPRCLRHAGLLLEQVLTLPSFATNGGRLLLDLSDALLRMPGPGHAARYYVSGVAARLANAPRQARTAFDRAQRSTADLPARCARLIAEASGAELEALNAAVNR